MARPKLIEDSVLLKLIQEYFDEECNGDIKKLKASEITRYINAHGHPNYPASTLRRTKAAVDFIESLKKQSSNERYLTVAAYQTIDAAALVDSNKSRNRLICAITERDLYYKRIADSAAHFFEKQDQLKKKYDAEKEKNLILTNKIEELEQQIKADKTELKKLRDELKATNSIIKTYVYPEIANELLEKEGIIRKTEHLLKEESIENEIITTTTDVKAFSKSNSNVIEGLFDI